MGCHGEHAAAAAAVQLMGHYADLEGGGQAAAQSWEKTRESVRAAFRRRKQNAGSVGIDLERRTDGR